MFFKRDLAGFPPLVSEAVKKGEAQETFIRIALLSKAKKMVRSSALSLSVCTVTSPIPAVM